MDEIDELYQNNKKLIKKNKDDSDLSIITEERDINQINEFLLNQPHHVFGEPDSMHSCDW